MKLQTGLSSCGPSALSNALQAIGWSEVPADAVAQLAGTTSDGTGAGGLKRAARALGAKVGLVSVGDGASAWALLRAHLLDGSSLVLAVDKHEHWVSAVGVLGSRVLVVDPAMVTRPMISAMSREELLLAWRHQSMHYGIVLSAKDLPK